jgi:diguanylate cyclase (GGDEF)-like protein
MAPTQAAGGARRMAASVGQWQVWTLRPVARLYVVAVVVLDWAVTLAALAAAAGQVSLVHLGLYLALLGCGFIVIEATRNVKEVKGTSTRDLMAVWDLTIAILFPPGFAFLSPLLMGALRLARVRRVFPYRRVFSAATMSLGWGAASAVFHTVPAARSGPHAVTWLLLAAGCFLVGWAINNGLILLAIRLATPEVRVRDAFGGRTGWISDLIELGLAVTVALGVAADPVVLLLALPTVVLCQRYIMNAQLDSQTRFDAQSGAIVSALWRHEADADAYRARRTGTPLTIVLVEIDDFASIGGVGPEATGTVLRAVATILIDKLPAAAQVGRLRGGEFAIVLPGVAEEDARRLGVRMRDHIAAELVAIENGGQVEFALRPTVSIGVAGLTEARQTVTELIAAADAALAGARASGGNQVSVAPDHRGPDPGVARAPTG